MAWTRRRLEEVARTRLGGTRFLVVSNREPLIHAYHGGEVRCMRPASGLTTALEPVVRACEGVWVAHGSGDADRAFADTHGRVQVPPEDPAYTLRRVWLSKEEEQGYYYGFSNEALWPLCHIAHTKPRFDSNDWARYREVNQRFADAVLDELGGKPALVFVQDYHFALLPRMLKNARPDLTVAQFWHIPWPNRDAFRICPWEEQILDGLLGNDLLSFHVQDHCNNFLDTVDRALEARVDWERFSVTRGGRATTIRPYPISIDPDLWNPPPSQDAGSAEQRIRQRFGLRDRQVLVGIDRVDYTKGLSERFRAVDRLLTVSPDFKRKFTFVQIGAPSRVQIPTYCRLHSEVEALIDSINRRHGDDEWLPIVYVNEHHEPEQIYTLYRMATACVVSSLHDGMNLVAKEFVAARSDLRGVLVLSRFTGAARELTSALLINPYDVDEFAQAIRLALLMTEEEQQGRMRRLRQHVGDNNIYRWAGMLLSEAGKLVEAKQNDRVERAYPGPAHPARGNGVCRLLPDSPIGINL